MLSSLFGDLATLKGGRPGDPAAGAEADRAFAATAILEADSAEVNDRGQIVERHLRDLFITGSPARAMREHFADSRAEMERAGKWIVLFDPARIWASAVVKTLSDAGGQPIERLQLREHDTLRTLALIERTTIVHRLDGALRVYHADVRASGRENAEISLALMERAHLSAVIVGPMQPHAIDAMLNTLHAAASQPTWRCPVLLFMVPPGAVWIANKIAGIAWPKGVRVQVLNESLSSASAVWNAVLGAWNHVRPDAPWDRLDAAPAGTELPGRTTESAAPQAGETDAGDPITFVSAGSDRPGSRAAEYGRAPAFDTQRAAQALSEMLRTEGLLACAVADSVSGRVLASEQREASPVDLDIAAEACAETLRGQRLAARSMGLIDPIDELTVGAGSRQQVLRVLARHPQLFLFALLDRSRTNLALARLKLLEAEKSIG